MQTDKLPVGGAPNALAFSHFPAPCFAVIWHNWNIVDPARIALAIETTTANVEMAAAMMGLIRDDSRIEKFKNQGYLTVIRTNWHLLNYEQLLILLDWTQEKLDFVLREDDFFWIKLGRLKPFCASVKWHMPSNSEKESLCDIATIVNAVKQRLAPGEKPFDFLNRYGAFANGKKAAVNNGLRMIYSPSALYGDPFIDENNDPYPDELLKDYAALGINALWLQGILYTLVPWLGETELSLGWQKRLERLKILAKRCDQYGIKLYLYLNEPRAIPLREMEKLSFGGTVNGNDSLTAFCPHAPGMTDALAEGIEQLCREVPELGGFFTITMNENITHCLSRDEETYTHICPNCMNHTAKENVVMVLNAIKRGIDNSGANLRLIAWTWNWSTDWDAEALSELDTSIDIMCVSETDVPTRCGNYASKVYDYSISKVGPGPVARRIWKLAREAGHNVVAKVQFNTTWELSAIPAIPVPFLVEKHIANLREEGIDDFMLSWTIGGVPSSNLELLNMSVQELAERDFGQHAPVMLEIWEEFSRAFAKFPFDGMHQIYFGPQNTGPANLLYFKPTGYKSTMVRGFPYDDLDSWRSIYPVDLFESVFLEISDEWHVALEKLQALPDTPKIKLQKVLGEAAYCFLRSTYLQIRFVRLRDNAPSSELIAIVEAEALLAERLIAIGRLDSSIGFESGNHYYYTENELFEKILNTNYLIKLLRFQAGGDMTCAINL